MSPKPRLVLVVDHVPNTQQSTVSYESFLVATRMIAMGATVDVIYLHDALESDAESQAWIAELLELGINFHPFAIMGLLRAPGIRNRFREMCALTAQQLWPVLGQKTELLAFVRRLEPKLVYVFAEYPVLFCFADYQNPLRLIAGDPPNDSLKHAALVNLQSKHVGLSDKIRALVSLQIARNMKRKTRILGRRLPSVGFHDLREVRSAQRDGWRQPYFAKPEVPDLGYSSWGENLQQLGRRSSGDPLRVVLFGQLGGQATASAIPYLSHEVIPRLSAAASKVISFEVVGKGIESLPASVIHHARAQGVIFRGFVPDLATELSRGDVVLLPIPSQKGSRPRILYAWSLAVPVLALSTVLGRLEGVEDPLEGNLNWTATDASGLVSLLEHCVDEPGFLVELGAASRHQFVRHYVEGALTIEMARQLGLEPRP